MKIRALNPFLLLLCGLLATQVSMSTAADIYRWTDAEGNTVYSDQKPSQDAKPAQFNNSINAYNPPQRSDKQTSDPEPITATLAELSADGEEESSDNSNSAPPKPAMTEESCQQDYGLSCDEVKNWGRYARERCGDDPRCEDPEFLDKKYRPRTLQEMQAIARRAAVRNNLQEKKIAEFLKRKYTNFCEVQAAQYCHRKRDRQCTAEMEAYCSDSRDLEDIFQRYSNLSMAERQEIIAQAKALVLENGDDPTNYDLLISSLIRLLVSQITMGL